MASAAKSAKLSPSLVRAGGAQRPSPRVASPSAITTSKKQAQIGEDDCLRPRAGKYDYSEAATEEASRRSKASDPILAIIDAEEGPTAWSKYGGAISVTPERAKELLARDTRVDGDGDEEGPVWFKYGAPVPPAAAMPAGETKLPTAAQTAAVASATEPELPTAPIPLAPQPSEFATLVIGPTLGSFYAAWRDADGRISAALSTLTLPTGAEIDAAPAVSNLRIPRALLLNGEAILSRNHLALGAFDPRQALAGPTEAEPDAQAPPPAGTVDPVIGPEAFSFAAPLLPLLHTQRQTLRLAPANDAGQVGEFSALAALSIPFALDGETSLEPITLTLPRPLELSQAENEPSSANHMAADPVSRAARLGAAPTSEPLPAPALEVAHAPEGLTLGAPPLLPPSGSGLDLPIGSAKATALRTLRVSMPLGSEPSVEPASLALPRAWSLGHGDTEDTSPVVSTSFDPLHALAEPAEPIFEAVAPTSQQTDRESIPALPSFAAPAFLPQSAAAHEFALAEARDLSAWAEAPQLQTFAASEFEPEALLPTLALPRTLPFAQSEFEAAALFLELGVDPLSALAEPVEPSSLAVEPLLPHAPVDEAQREPMPASEAPETLEEPQQLPQPTSEIVEAVGIGEPHASPNLELAAESTAAETADIFGIEEATVSLLPELASDIEAPQEAHEPSAAIETVDLSSLEGPTAALPAELGSEIEAPPVSAPEAAVPTEPDRDAERRAAIAALTDQLSSVVGTVLQTQNYATLASRRSRSTADPGVGARKTHTPAGKKPVADDAAAGSAIVVDLSRRRRGAGHPWAWTAMAATLAAIAVVSGFFVYGLGGPVRLASAPPARPEVAAISPPAPTEAAPPLISDLQPENYFESSQLVRPVSNEPPQHKHHASVRHRP